MEGKASLIAVVTGGNRGIGFEICRQLAVRGVTVVLTARDETRGAEAAGELRRRGLPGDVAFHQLEVSEPAGAAHLAGFIKDKFGKLDILVNNAGIVGLTTDVGDPAILQETLAGMDALEKVEWLKKGTTQTTQQAEDCLRINYHGTKNVTEALLPLVEASSGAGRIVNVSSFYGLLRFFSGDELRRELDSAGGELTARRLDELSSSFMEDFRGGGALEPRGWPADRLYAPYQMSKALVCAYTRVLAREKPALRVNCLHPGYVSTDINHHTGDLTAAEGAAFAVAIALAVEEFGAVTGAYFDRAEMASYV